jgi:hypothetical protein
MTTATRKAKADSESAAATAAPITFAEIAKNKTRERLEAYRQIVHRRADGEMLSVADMERAGELLDQLGLPLYTFDRDADAVRRFRLVRDKYQAAVDAVPESQRQTAELAAEIESLKQRVASLQERHRIASAKAGKPAAYSQTVAMLQLDHPHVLADIDKAAELRIADLDRRRQGGAE